MPGYLDDPVELAVVQRIGRTAPTTGVVTIHGGGTLFRHHLDSYVDWLLDHDVVLVSVD